MTIQNSATVALKNHPSPLVNAAIEALLDLDAILESMPDSARARMALVPALARVAELARLNRQA